MADGKAGLTDYAGGSTPLTADNYTAEDAMVFSQLSYSDMSWIEEGKSYTVGEYAQGAIANEMKLQEEARLAGDAAGVAQRQDKIDFLTTVASSDRYSGLTVHNFAEATPQADSSQWAAMTIDLGDNTSVVAMRGTDGSTVGWTEDFELLTDVNGTKAQNYAAQYMAEADPSRSYFMTGHSKGGNDITSAYVMSDPSIRDRILRLDNFDGPGMNDNYISFYQDGYNELAGKLNNYYPYNSVVGRLLVDNPGNTYYIQATNREGYQDVWIMGEHDLFSWHFEDGKMQQTKGNKGSLLSDLINSLLDNKAGGMSYAQRVQLIQNLERLGLPGKLGKQNPYTNDYTSGNGANSNLNTTQGKNQYIYRLKKAKCTFGDMEQNLNLPLDHGVIFSSSEQPLMNAGDHIAEQHICSFGRCKSPANPAGWSGIPPKCVPMTILPWLFADRDYVIDGVPALTQQSQICCFFGGVISVVKEKQENPSEVNNKKEPTKYDKKSQLPSEVSEKLDKFSEGAEVNQSSEGSAAVEADPYSAGADADCVCVSENENITIDYYDK